MKLSDYIRGARKGKEAHHLQKEAMRDPFLADAMDGYDRVGENQEPQIEILRRRIRRKAKGKRNHAVVWSVAASLLIGICLSSYFIHQKNRLPEDIFATLEALQRDTVFQVVPQMPQSPLAKSVYPEEKEKSAGVVRRDSEKKVFDNRKREIARVAPAEAQEKKSDEAERSAITDIAEAEAIEADLAEADVIEADVSEIDSAADRPVVVKQVATVMATVASGDMAKQSNGMADGAKINGVKGRVIDEFGEPIIGATIAVRGTDNGTISDENGNFTLSMNDGREITVNYIGYEPVVLPADTTKEMLIAMNEDNNELNEVVVVGYGRQRKANLTGSVATVEQLTMPRPVIGRKAYRKYLKKNLNRPTDEECTQVKGEVILTFHVNEEGRPVDIKVQESLCPSADKEAVRLVREGPQWTVGGKEVTLEIQF